MNGMNGPDRSSLNGTHSMSLYGPSTMVPFLTNYMCISHNSQSTTKLGKGAVKNLTLAATLTFGRYTWSLCVAETSYASKSKLTPPLSSGRFRKRNEKSVAHVRFASHIFCNGWITHYAWNARLLRYPSYSVTFCRWK